MEIQINKNSFSVSTWIVQAASPNKKLLVPAILKSDANLVVCDFEKDQEQLKDLDTISELGNLPFVFVGSIEGCKLIKQLQKSTRVHATFSNYLCTNYYSKFGKYLLNNDYIFINLKELWRQKWMLYGLFGADCKVFVRPNCPEKPFVAQLVDLQELEQFANSYEDQLVVVSSPKTIQGEWRFIIGGGEIITQSCYIYQGLRTLVNSAPSGATELCKKILSEGYFPDEFFCIDVAQDKLGDFWLMELTGFSSSGWYAADYDKIVQKVNELVKNN